MLRPLNGSEECFAALACSHALATFNQGTVRVNRWFQDAIHPLGKNCE